MLVKYYFVNALPTISKGLVGIIFLRIFVEYFGKGGLGQIAQVQALNTLVYAIINGLFFSYVVSSAWEDKKKEKEININDIFCLIALFTTIIGIFIFSFGNIVGIKLIENVNLTYQITTLAIMCPIIGIYIAMSAKLCSEGFLVQFNILNAIGILISGLMVLIIINYFGINGAFVAVSIFYLSPAIIIFLAYRKYIKEKFLIIKISTIKKFPYKSILSLSFIGLFMVISAIVLKILVRNEIYKTLGWENVGNWEAINKISDTYLLLVTAPLANYLMPTISRSTNFIVNHKIIIKMLWIGITLILLASTITYLIWDSLILKIIGQQFVELKKYLLIQQAGDLFKIINWTLCIVALSYKKYKFIIICEVIWALLYYSLVHSLLEIHNLTGTFYAYLVANFILAVILLSEYLRSSIKFKISI